jgi:hypothetical protein
MFRFLRKLRQKVFGNKTWSRYILYAVSEVVLVMIGILLALQVNNWNEARKLQNEETGLLRDLRSDLVKSNYYIQDSRSYNLYTIGEYEKIYEFLEKDLPYTEDMDNAFGFIDNWGVPYLAMNAYETLKSKGISLISNENIKDLLVDIYEYDFPILEEHQKEEWMYHETVKLPMIIRHIENFDLENDLSRPHDIRQLKSDVGFKLMVSHLINLRYNGSIIYKETYDRVDHLIKMIDRELYSGEESG